SAADCLARSAFRRILPGVSAPRCDGPRATRLCRVPRRPRPTHLPPTPPSARSRGPMNPRMSLLTAGLLLSAGLASAADWPQWPGPHRDGHSPETGLMKSFPPGGPKLLWTFDKAGIGYSAPAVVGGKVYCLGDDARESVVFALDLATGK